MKRLMLIFGLFCPYAIHAQYTWSPQVSNVSTNITDIHVTTPGNAVGIFGTAVGEIGRMNDGVTWVTSYNLPEINGDPLSDYITGVYIEGTSPNYNCVVVTKGGQIYKSIDGGTTWDLKYSSNPSLSCNDLDYGNNRLITGGQGKIYYSDDVGETWDSVTVAGAGEITQLSLIGTTGVLTSQNQLFYTTNGGLSWIQMTGLPHLYDIHGVEMTNASTIFTVGAFGEIFGTDDLGTSWTSIVSGTNEHLYKIEFANFTNGLISGENGTLLMTDQGGFNAWDSSTHNATGTSGIGGLHAHNATYAWFGNDDGELHKAPEVTLVLDITDVIGPDTVCQGETYTYTIEYDVTQGTAVDPAFQILLNGTNISGGYATHNGTFGLGTYYFDLTHTANEDSEGAYGYVVTASPNASQTSVFLDYYGFTETENVFVKFPEATSVTSPIYFCPDDEITLNATGGNDYTWYGGTTNSTPLTDLTQYPLVETSYIVEIEQDYCTVYDTVYAFFDVSCFQDTTTQDSIPVQGKIEAYAFSPDGDGVNDNFVLDFLGSEQNQVYIFNRYGDEIATFQNYDNETVVWDGTYMGVPVVPGTYFFVVEYSQNERHVGWVQIVK